MRISFLLFLFGGLCWPGFLHADKVDSTAATVNSFPFQNPDLPLDKRLDDLIGRMTVDEKISQLMMDTPGIARLNIPAYHYWNEGLHGLARNGIATVFPQAIAMAATWDPDLQEKVGDAVATEFRAKNNEIIAKTGGASKIYQGLTVWSPNINIFRDPRWGRGQETYGEDPFLTGQMGVGYVRGLQGNDPTYLKTVATLKHFAVHSGPESLRHKFNVDPSPRDLRETYLPAFEAGVREGHAWSVMSAYNAVYGIPAPANAFLLTDVLRKSWGFQGAVVGDVDTVSDMIGAHHYAKDGAVASAEALLAGNDECSGHTYNALPDSLKQGLVKEADIDQALRRLLTLRFKLGQFDPPDRVPYRSIPPSQVGTPEHDALALQDSRENIVLLKNDGTLPWNISDLHTVAVLGPTADDSSTVIGNYSGKPAQTITLLQGLKNKLEPNGVKVLSDPAVPLVTGFRETGEPVPPGVLFVDEQKSAPGWKGEVFDNDQFSGKPVTRTDENLSLFWNQAQPAPNLPLTNVHARWSSVLYVPKTDDYALCLTFCGTASLYLDDKLIAGDAKLRNPEEVSTRSAGVHLEAGHAYRLRIEYHQGANASTGKISFGWRPPQNGSKALELAGQADHIILMLGITPNLETEEMHLTAPGFFNGDRTSIQLPASQQDLLTQVAGLGKPFIVVLTSGSALSFNTSKPHAIFEVWYYGQRGADALAEEIFGQTNPSGHLPVTFYKSDADLPDFEDYSMKNRTYRYFTGKPLFAFGYGLSYTSFNFDHPQLSSSTLPPTGTVNLTVDVSNTGKRDGDEVVQVYAHAQHPPVDMPQEWLVGFKRVSIAAGKTQSVSLSIPAQRLRHWDEKSNAYLVDPGAYDLRIGDSSDNILKTAILTIQ